MLTALRKNVSIFIFKSFYIFSTKITKLNKLRYKNNKKYIKENKKNNNIKNENNGQDKLIFEIDKHLSRNLCVG
jgi:hypothetical protein